MLEKIFQWFFTKLLSILDCNIFKIIILTCINKSNKLNSLSDISIKYNVDFFINFSERSSGKLLVNGRRLHHLVEISISDCCMWIQMTYALIDITFVLLLNSSFYVRALFKMDENNRTIDVHHLLALARGCKACVESQENLLSLIAMSINMVLSASSLHSSSTVLQCQTDF